jgi:hypothetical protein
MSDGLSREEALGVKMENAELVAKRLRYWIETGRKPLNAREVEEKKGAVSLAQTMLGTGSNDMGELVQGLEDLVSNVRVMLEG